MKKMFTRTYSKYLYESKDKEVYLLRPTQKQWDNIKQYMINTLQQDKDGGYSVNEEKSIVYIKLIYDLLSSQSEETKPMTLEKFADSLNKVVFELKIKQAVSLYRKVEELIRDICEEIKYDTIQTLHSINDYSDTMELLIDKQNLDKRLETLTNEANTISKLNKEQEKDKEEIVETNNNQIED